MPIHSREWKSLTDAEVAHFVERGLVRVRGAIPREAALAAQDYLWGQLAERGVNRRDRNTWTQPMLHMKEAFCSPVFDVCMTDRLVGAIEDLTGPGRWKRTRQRDGWGWWPVNFSEGSERPWSVPRNGWHWDGIQFLHTVHSPDQGLLMLCMFSDTGSRGGATMVAEGSHQVVARYLAGLSEPISIHDAIPACSRSHPWLAELTGISGAASNLADPGEAEARRKRFMDEESLDEYGTRLRVTEAIADAGDVYLCHPFLYHAAAQNHVGEPRFMCNRTTPLSEPLLTTRPVEETSPVEEAIRVALAAEKGSAYALR